MKKIVLKGSITGLLLLAGLSLKAQDLQLADTVKIREVSIKREHIIQSGPGFKKIFVDTALLIEYSNFSVTDVLNEVSPLNIKCYGSGGTATTSFRGASAVHTIVLWNGININHPMLGQSDFSLLPASMIDNIRINYGGASMEAGDGGMGGAILLENNPRWKKRTCIDINPGMGSFGNYSGSVRLESGTENFQAITKAFILDARNNFPYIDTVAKDPVRKNRMMNYISQKGVMQELYLKYGENNVVSARLWYQTAYRDLPGSLDYGYMHENQKDESFRSMINYSFSSDSINYFIKAAWMYSGMDYNSEFFGNDEYHTKTLALKGGITCPVGKYTRVNLILNNELNSVVTNKYLENIRKNNGSVTLSAERRTADRIGAQVLLRETMESGKLLVPDFSAGLELRVLRGVDQFLKANVSKNSRIPSLNDLYWNPGGNDALKNEYNVNYELGYKIFQSISGELSLNAEIDIYKNHVRNMIRWIPDTAWNYTAVNLGKVDAHGFEAVFSADYRKNRFVLVFNSGYTYSKASEVDIQTSGESDNQLVYVPVNQVKNSLQMIYGNFYATWLSNYTGITYRDPENILSLPGFCLNHLVAGYKLPVSGNIYTLQMKVENVFNISYQTIAYYPMPGRSFFLSANIRFIR